MDNFGFVLVSQADRRAVPQVSTTAVRALSFNVAAATAKSQLLAIGDDEGMLRVAEVPSTLRRPMPGEHSRMSRFLEVQTQKVADTESRQVRALPCHLIDAAASVQDGCDGLNLCARGHVIVRGCGVSVHVAVCATQ